MSADVDTVRLLTADQLEPPNQLFTDRELMVFLSLEAGNIRRAAAQALDTIASSEVLVSKVITSQDLSTDGAKVAAELRARADSLREQDAQSDDGGYFEIIPPACSNSWSSRSWF